MLPLDPKKPLYGFRVKCPHAWRRVHLFRDDGDDFTFFRPRSFGADWMGTLEADRRSIRWSTYWSEEETAWHWIKRDLRLGLAGSYFWRVFYLDDPCVGVERTWRILWRPDFGYVEPVGQSSDDFSGAYFWPRLAKFNLWKIPTAMLKHHFEREWSDPQSDVRTALSWCDLSSEERETQAVIWKRGNRATLEQLTIAAMRLVSFKGEQTLFEPVYPFHIWWVWDKEGQHVQLDIPWYNDMAPDLKCWRRLYARIEEHHRGIYNLPNGNRNDWIFPWLDYESPFSSSRWVTTEFDVSSPTQHERMEAALFLRDWLRDNAPDLLPDWFPEGV